MRGTALRDVIVVHSFVSAPGERLVKEWADHAFPEATVVSLRDDWSASSYDDDVLVVPVGLATDTIGLAQIVVGAPATIGAFRQLYYLGNDGVGSFEDFIARSLAGDEDMATHHD